MVGTWCKKNQKTSNKKNYGYQLRLYLITGNKSKPTLVNKENMNKFINSNLPEKTLYFDKVTELGNYSSILNIPLFHIADFIRWFFKSSTQYRL